MREDCWGKFADGTNTVAAHLSKSCGLTDETDGIRNTKNTKNYFCLFSDVAIQLVNHQVSCQC